MPLFRTNLHGSVSNAAASFGSGGYTTAPFTPPDNSLLVVAVEAVEEGGTTNLVDDLTISDSAGRTWTPRVQQGADPVFGVAVRIWTAPVAAGASMTVTVDCGPRSVFAYEVSIVAYTGHDVTSPVGATGASFQQGGFTGPPDPASLALNAAPAATSEVFAAAGVNRDTAGVTPGAGWGEIHDLQGSGGGLQTQARAGSTSPAVAWADVRAGGGNLFKWAAVAVEIRQAPTSVWSYGRDVVIG